MDAYLINGDEGDSEMITNREIKKSVEEAIKKLQDAKEDIDSALSVTGNKGIRIDLWAIRADIKALITKAEDTIYPPEEEPEVFELKTDNDVTIARFSE